MNWNNARNYKATLKWFKAKEKEAQMNAQDRTRLRPGLIEVALCEDCGASTEWHQRGGHPWHHRRCSMCGSERVSRCETKKEGQVNE